MAIKENVKLTEQELTNAISEAKTVRASTQKHFGATKVYGSKFYLYNETTADIAEVSQLRKVIEFFEFEFTEPNMVFSISINGNFQITITAKYK